MAVEMRGRVGTKKGKRSRAAGSLVTNVATRWGRIRKRYTWWQITLFLIGAVSAVSIVSGLFFAVGDRPARITTDREVPP